MPLSDLVSVTFVSNNPGVTQAGFGVPLIASANAAWTERVRSYSSLADVEDDFAATTPEYLAAEVMFSQSTGLERLLIGRCANKPTQRWALAVNTAAQLNGVYSVVIEAPSSTAWVKQTATYTAVAATAWAAATAYAVGALVSNDSGKLYVATVGGTSAGSGGPTGVSSGITDNTVTWNYAGAGAAGVASNDAIMYALKNAIDAFAVPTVAITTSLQGSAGSLTLRLQANTAGDFFGVECTDPDLLLLKQDHVDPGIAADLAALARASREWYGLVTLYNSEAYILAAAAWVEANEKLYTPDTQDTRVITDATASATDICEQLKDLSYARTGAFYHPANSEFAGAAEMARYFPITPGGDNWIYKTLAGVTVKDYSSTHETNLRAKYTNWYAELAGANIIQGEGKVAANEYIDVVRFRDWYKARLQERGANIMIQEEKVPFTDAGIAKFEAMIRGLNDEGIAAGGIANDPKPTVTVPTATSVSAADRAARRLPGVKSKWRLAGAINELDVEVTAQP